MSAPGDGGFRSRGRVAETVHRADREAARDALRRFRAVDGFEALVAEQVVERAVAIGRAREPMEWMGLLVGRICEDERGRYVVVLGMVLDRGAAAGPSDVRSTPDSEAETRRLARELLPDCVALGWIHGHIRHGPRYSAVDRANQRTWRQPHSVGIVVDPWSDGLLGVYRGPDSELLRPVATRGVPEPERAAAARPPAPRLVARPSRARRPWTWRNGTVAALALVAALAACAAGRVRALEDRLARIERAGAGRAPRQEAAACAAQAADVCIAPAEAPRGAVCAAPPVCSAAAAAPAEAARASAQRRGARRP